MKPSSVYSRVLLEDERLVSFSEKFDITPAQIILTWLTSKNVCVLPKTNDPIRQVENYQSKTHGGSLRWKAMACSSPEAIKEQSKRNKT